MTIEWKEEKAKIKDEGFTATVAQAVHKYLNALEDNRKNKHTRWIWELLQNAHDAATTHDKNLIVSIKHDPEELVFLHNGSGFEKEQIQRLIFHGSTKVEDEETKGQYGSGFLATHLLSPEIDVSGQLDGGQWFDFHLERKPETVEALRKSMNQAWDNFNPSSSLRVSMPSPFTTRFRYPIIEDKHKKAAKAGIKELKRCAPYVVAFNEKFIRIDIKDHDETLSFEVVEHLSLDAVGIQQITVIESRNGKSKERKYLTAQGEKKTSVTARLESNGDGSVCLPVEETPRLFSAFPLVGTESFSFPAVINNWDFKSREDRDGVSLGQSDNEANHNNQAIIEEACGLLIDLLQFAVSRGWHHVHQWTEIPAIEDKDWLNTEWLRMCLKENLIEKIRQTPIVLNADDNPVVTKNAKLPLAKSKTDVQTLWDLIGAFNGNHKFLPKREEAIGWCDAIKSWATVYQNEPMALFSEGRDGAKTALSIEKFLEKQESGRIERFQNSMQESVSVIDWLNQFYGFLKNNGFDNEIQNRRIILDQSGGFHPLRGLYRDNNIDEELKDIAELLGWYVRRELRDNQLTSLAEEAGAGDRNSKNIVESLIKMLQERVSQVISSQNPDTNFKQAALQLFAWLVRQNQQNYWSHLRNVPILTKDGIYRPSLSSVMLPNDPPLAPIRAWSEDLQQFSELFPLDRILDDSFFEVIPDPDLWQRLCEQNFIRRNMIRRWDGLTDLKPFSPEIYENEDDGGDHESEEAFSAISVVAWEAIMNRVRSSRDSAYLFWGFLIFLTEFIEEKTDGPYLDEKSVQCKFCGKIHKYYPSIWLKAVRSNKWIRDGDPRFRADAPSLAKLLREKGWNFGSLENPSTVKLLTAINVSPSDLRLELITGNPEARDALVSTMTELHQITGGDLSQVQAIVQHVQKIDGDLSQTLEVIQHMQEDENFSEYLAERQEQTRRVHENQHLGTQVENLVRENLENEGFLVSPTGIGSDFEVRLNIVRNDKNWLIEVKSTRQEGDHQSVRMTSKQAETAVKEKDKFLLCVVPLGQEDIIPETVRENMRFIQNIGDSIAPLWADLKLLKKKPADIDIILDVEEGKAGILVKKSVWENDGFPLEKLAEHLK